MMSCDLFWGDLPPYETLFAKRDYTTAGSYSRCCEQLLYFCISRCLTVLVPSTRKSDLTGGSLLFPWNGFSIGKKLSRPTSTVELAAKPHSRCQNYNACLCVGVCVRLCACACTEEMCLNESGMRAASVLPFLTNSSTLIHINCRAQKKYSGAPYLY